MNTKWITSAVSCLSFALVGCSEGPTVVPESVESEMGIALAMALSANGATQISGVGFFAGPECDAASQGATFALNMTGDLEGCVYVFVDDFNCSPSGTYRESGRELFVVTYGGATGTFTTTYKFAAKYEGCAPDGSFLGAEIFGRCQHPLVRGSGTGVFQGATGRVDFKDDVQAGNFPYRGHLTTPATG